MTEKLQSGFDFAAGDTYVPDWKKRVEFDGETFNPQTDAVRLNRQLQAVFNLMKDGRWRTLRQIAGATKKPEASVSARLRDFRKERFGSWDVQRRNVGDGLFEYRLVAKGVRQ